MAIFTGFSIFQIIYNGTEYKDLSIVCKLGLLGLMFAEITLCPEKTVGSNMYKQVFTTYICRSIIFKKNVGIYYTESS